MSRSEALRRLVVRGVARCAVGLALGLVTFSNSLWAASWTWNGGGGDDKWSTTANWVEGTAPSSATTSLLTFGGGTRLTPDQDIAHPFSFNTMVLSNNAGAFVLGGWTNVNGQSALRSYSWGGTTPLIQCDSANNIVIKGCIRAPSGTSTVKVNGTGRLQIPWITGANGYTVVKEGPGTLTILEDADGQYYNEGQSNVGPIYNVKDGVLEVGSRTSRYYVNGTNWSSAAQNKMGYGLTIGDGVGAATSAVVRSVGNGGFCMNPATPITINADGLLDLNNVAGPDIYGTMSNAGVVKLRSLSNAIYFRDGSALTLVGDAVIDGTASDGLWLYDGMTIRVDDTRTRATILAPSRGGLGDVDGPTCYVSNKPNDSVSLEIQGTMGAFSRGGALKKYGPGTLAISNYNYNGVAQTVYEGALAINGVANGTAGSAWVANTNGTLGGWGVITGSFVTVNSGTINPGISNRVGVLTVWSNVTFNGAAKLVIDVVGGGSTPGVDFDQLLVKKDVTGLANVALTVNIIGSPKFSGASMTILDAGNSLAGATFNSTTLVNGGRNTLTVDTSGADVVIRLKPPPEGTMVLFK